ncbi:MAG: hypothetical protein AB7U75_20665 [Hyphomicrobiaceae bacterium]
MFDLSRVTEMLGGFAEQAELIAPEGLMQGLADLGFDPTQLQESGIQELLGQLSDLGVDINAMDDSRIGDMVAQISGAGHASE